MKKKITAQKNILIIALVFLISILVLIVGLKNDNSGNGSFDSKYLQFSVDLPNGFQATDGTSRIAINSDPGTIYVSRNGTQFKDLDSYIADFDSRRKLTPSDANKLTIDGYEALSRTVVFPDQNYSQRSYYVYVNNAIYVFSTSSEELYDELDQIARSFKYTGE